MEFKIEKNIPIPDGNRSRTGYFDSLGKMEVGDSFKFDIKLRNRIRQFNNEVQHLG